MFTEEWRNLPDTERARLDLLARSERAKASAEAPVACDDGADDADKVRGSFWGIGSSAAPLSQERAFQPDEKNDSSPETDAARSSAWSERMHSMVPNPTVITDTHLVYEVPCSEVGVCIAENLPWMPTARRVTQRWREHAGKLPSDVVDGCGAAYVLRATHDAARDARLPPAFCRAALVCFRQKSPFVMVALRLTIPIGGEDAVSRWASDFVVPQHLFFARRDLEGKRLLDMSLDLAMAVECARANHDAPFDDIELLRLHVRPIGLDCLEVGGEPRPIEQKTTPFQNSDLQIYTRSCKRYPISKLCVAVVSKPRPGRAGPQGESPLHFVETINLDHSVFAFLADQRLYFSEQILFCCAFGRPTGPARTGPDRTGPDLTGPDRPTFHPLCFGMKSCALL